MAVNDNRSKRSLSPMADDEVNENGDGEHQGRQRARAACAPCRQRKRKCNGRMPCATCVRYEYECTYSSMKRGSYTPARKQHKQVGNGPQEPGQQRTVVVEESSQVLPDQAHASKVNGTTRYHHRSLLDPAKARYVRANSAIAFPRVLALELESDSVPRLHSFAWNLGIRPEPQEHHPDITTILTWADVQELSRVYFRTLRVEMGLLDEPEFMECARERFANPHGNKDIDSIILGVAALGSLYSPNSHPAEEVFVASARTMLYTRSLATAPNMEMVIGWILRTMYQRITGRPHAAWMSGSIAMHHIEACGLHKELQSIAVVYPAISKVDVKFVRQRRRVFWIARAFNAILSFEFGRSRVYLDHVTTKKFSPEPDNNAHQYVELATLLPSDYVDLDKDVDPPAALSTSLTGIEQMKIESPFMNLLRADLAFAIYRRLWLMSLTDAKERADTVIEIGKKALIGATTLLARREPWPNISGTPFQFLCVLIAIDTPKSLALVPSILEHIRQITHIYDTHMVREAYNQALALAHMARARKQRELGSLNEIEGLVPFEDPPTNMSCGGMSEMANIDWSSLDMGFDWDTFLNPALIVSGEQSHVGCPPALAPEFGLGSSAMSGNVDL